MALSVVVVNWNSKDDLHACLASLASQTLTDLEVVVVDNGSHDGSVELVRDQFPSVTLLAQNTNLGFAEACNLGIEATRGDWIAMLNNDAVAEPAWAETLVVAGAEADSRCGMLQSLLLFQDRNGTINSTGIELAPSGGGRDRDEHKPRADTVPLVDVFCPTAGAAAYRRTMLQAIKLRTGCFDGDHFMYYEDLDLGWRARLCGWSAKYIGGSVVHHKWHGSSNRHGSDWLTQITSINRVRTLVKNASPAFILRTAPETLLDLLKVVWAGGSAGVRQWLQAVRKSLRLRRDVAAMQAVSRTDLERRWVAR